MPAYFDCAFAHTSVGRRSSARLRSIGVTSAGALNFRVEPSAAAALGASLVAAEGAVGASGDFEQAAEIVKAARQIPTRKSNFINRSPRCWLAECCEGQGLGTTGTHIAARTISEVDEQPS